MKKLMVLSLLALCTCKNEESREAATDGHHPDSSGVQTDKKTDHISSLHNSMDQMMNKMKTMPVTGNPDRDFALMMKYHHEGAVEMSKIQLAGGADPEMKSKAEQIIKAQQTEIVAFDEFLSTNKDTTGSSRLGEKLISLMTPMQHPAEGVISSVDASFVNLMIPHHQDGINMAKEYLKEARNGNLKKIATNIISSQEKEIEEF